MESKVKDITQKYLELEMNVEKTVLGDADDRNSIKLRTVIPPMKEHQLRGVQTEELIKEITYIMECVEKNQKLFTKLIPPNKCLVGEPLTKVTNVKDYCSFFIQAIRENVLWKYVNIEYGLWPSNALFCVWKTICFALFDNRNFCSSLLHDREYYPKILQDYLVEACTVPTIMKTAVIVLADADLDSVVNFLASITKEPCVWKISKVYVQESGEKKFMQLYRERRVKDSMDVESILTIFRFKEELPSKIENHTDAISIWTENVSAAKSFVMNILVPLTWINSYGELGPGIVIRTDAKLRCPSVSKFELTSNFYSGSGKKFDLFYDGVWKEPKSGKYWVDSNATSWASASQVDVNSCVLSAKKGFDKWHCVPLSQRKQVLQKFADRIFANGNTPLANLIKSQLQNPTLFGSSSTIIRDGTVEVLTIRDPKGVVAIGRKDPNDLFLRLINACIAGNSVIVMHGGLLCPIAEYCDMLITSGIPPGVINSLSFENLVDGFREVYNNSSVSHGCSQAIEEFDVYMLDFFKYWIDLVTTDHDPRLNEMIYTKYTQPKSIWLPLK